MDKIMNFIDKVSLEKILPKIDSILDVILWLMQWAVKLGPLCILVLGLIYMLIPPKEANRYFGYRTYFGMGSISAWLFTQRVAGALMTLTGLVLYLMAKKAADRKSHRSSERTDHFHFGHLCIHVPADYGDVQSQRCLPFPRSQKYHCG